ncbi:MAG: hypothetical protein HGB04_09830 [Chlorobiaceae bacterium]|nr:hypothetical protein [Chlorobiaceae bacterium]
MPFSWLRKRSSKPVSGSKIPVRLTLEPRPAEPADIDDAIPATPSGRCGFVTGIPTESRTLPQITSEPVPAPTATDNGIQDELDEEDNPFLNGEFTLWGNRVQSRTSGQGKPISTNRHPI